MIDIHNFDEIRPFRDHEVRPMMDKLLELPFYRSMAKRFFPDVDPDRLKEVFKQVNSIHLFQTRIIYPILKKIMAETSEGLSENGFQTLEKEKAYLFISNHHDIILDPSLLNLVLYENGFRTTEVAIGDNLMQTAWIRDIARLNRSFIVHRTLSVKESFFYSQRLSNYIRKTIIDDNESVWIAQREGRAKDGNDFTQVSLLKMLAYGGEEDKFEYLRSLNFLPVAISYEYDPCDMLKVKEALAKEKNSGYRKNQKEDERSMITGLMGYKGGIHLSAGTPIDKEFDEILHRESTKEQFSSLAATIDEQIQRNIKLWPTNYIAYDALMKMDTYHAQYTEEEKRRFYDYLDSRLKKNQLDNDEARIRLLSIYANPVKNKIRLTEF